MDLILLDWTRMGRSYCLAGVVIDNGNLYQVRPLPVKYRDAPVRNTGWSAYQLDGHRRWEFLELVGPSDAAPEPPHLEDLWVRSLRPRGFSATRELRQAVLQATRAEAGRPWFGAPLAATRACAYLQPGAGERSLTTLVVPAGAVRFRACQRQGHAEEDYRVEIHVPGLEGRQLPVKDHHLLRQAEAAAADLPGRVEALRRAVAGMGAEVAVRLGLSRPFAASAQGADFCWLMADGFFSLADPQP
jgi:hypothetical protein